MAGRGSRKYYRKDNGKLISAEDTYTMVMLYSYQRLSIEKIARRYSLSVGETRTILGKSLSGSCCG